MMGLFKRDVQRWIVPGEVMDISPVTWKRTVSLLVPRMQLRAISLFHGFVNIISRAERPARATVMGVPAKLVYEKELRLP